MYVLLTVGSIFSKPKEGPAVPTGMALGAMGGMKGHLVATEQRMGTGMLLVPQELSQP